jgi:hypothetical protein
LTPEEFFQELENIRVVRKLKFPNNFRLERLGRQPTGLANKSNVLIGVYRTRSIPPVPLCGITFLKNEYEKAITSI